MEGLEKSPHGALRFTRAVTEGSRRVLGSAAEMMSVHSLELAAAEAVTAAAVPTGKGAGGGASSARTDGLPDHWKPWRRDGLDALERTLGEQRGY